MLVYGESTIGKTTLVRQSIKYSIEHGFYEIDSLIEGLVTNSSMFMDALKPNNLLRSALKEVNMYSTSIADQWPDKPGYTQRLILLSLFNEAEIIKLCDGFSSSSLLLTDRLNAVNSFDHIILRASLEEVKGINFTQSGQKLKIPKEAEVARQVLRLSAIKLNKLSLLAESEYLTFDLLASIKQRGKDEKT